MFLSVTLVTGALVLTILYFSNLTPPKPKPPLHTQNPSDTLQAITELKEQDVEQEVNLPSRKIEDPLPLPPPDIMVQLTQDILGIAPEVYDFVTLDIENQISTRDSNPIPKLSLVHGITINVKSKSWNKYDGTKKVALLHQTFDKIKTHYPDITPFVKLKFDDGRKDLDLRFDDLYQNKH